MLRFAVPGLVFLLVAVGATVRAENPTQTLAGYRGSRRVLLVFAASGQDPDYAAQRRLWDPEQAGFADRDLVTLPLFAADRASRPLAEKYGVNPGRFAVVLVGKDGHEAFRAERPVPAGDLYARIDAMPMRRDEMRRKDRGGGDEPSSAHR